MIKNLNQTDKITEKYFLSFVIKVLFLSIGLSSFHPGNTSYASPLKIGIGQFFHDTGSFEANKDKILFRIDQANASGCDIVIFDEWALSDPNNSVSKAQFDEAINSIKTKAANTGMFIVCGVMYRESDNPVRYHQRALVVNSSGIQESFYRKYIEIPEPFNVKGIPCHVLLCADRWFLESADLLCLVQNTKVIIDISGGHGGDEGRPAMRWIRYRPWAQRTNAFIIVANPPHYSVDFMGNKPWGGHSAIINPDGIFTAKAAFQNDTLIVATINPEIATRAMAMERRNNMVFKSFWDMGKNILEGNVPNVEPYTEYLSSATTLKVAAVQMVCSRIISKNIETMAKYIAEAAQNGADLVVFPELAVTGSMPEDIKEATQTDLNAALISIQQKAKEHQITVLFGMPFLQGNQYRNSAWIIGTDGNLQTRYDQIAQSANHLYEPGRTVKTMWFRIKGAYATVSIGKDADYPEITILAASKGTQMHFHISNENDSTADAEIIRKQKCLNLLASANFGTIVNAGKPKPEYISSCSHATGGSMICLKTGGHGKPNPGGVETYFPYTASILLSAEANEDILYATYTTAQTNKSEAGRNNTRKNMRPEWYEWIKRGVQIISPE